MVEKLNALSGAAYEVEGLSLREEADFTLTQYAGSDLLLRRDLGIIPGFGQAETTKTHTLFRIGPQQVQALGPEIETKLHVTPLSSARCRIAISGARARALLAACAAVDFTPQAFGPGAVVMTGIHHMPVLIHAVSAEEFHVYGMRSFAHSLWHWLQDAATAS